MSIESEFWREVDHILQVKYLSYLNLTYLESIVGPRSKLHEARLVIEGEVPDVDFARRFENGRRRPQYFACVVQHGFCHRRHHVLAVGAAISTKHMHFTRWRLDEKK
jgi:hypothetical protein